MALSDACSDFINFMDEDPSQQSIRHELDELALEIEGYSDRGYGSELEAMRGLIAITRASSDHAIDILVLFCRVVQTFHDTWPGDEPTETEAKALMDAMSAEILARLSATGTQTGLQDAWDVEAQALLDTFANWVKATEARIIAELSRLETQQQTKA